MRYSGSSVLIINLMILMDKNHKVLKKESQIMSTLRLLHVKICSNGCFLFLVFSCFYYRNSSNRNHHCNPHVFFSSMQRRKIINYSITTYVLQIHESCTHVDSDEYVKYLIPISALVNF